MPLSQSSYYRHPDFFKASFFGSWGRAILQLSRPDVFFTPGLNASNRHFMLFNVNDAFSVEPRAGFFFFLFWSCWSLDNEGIQEDPERNGREVQEKKSLGGLRENGFFSPCCVWKPTRNLTTKTSSLVFVTHGITEATEFKVTSKLAQLNLSLSVSLAHSKCRPGVGAPLLDFTGCSASGPPGFQAPWQCCPQTGRYSRKTARKPQLARRLNTTHVWDRLYPTHTLL